jgi:hypothetical protein
VRAYVLPCLSGWKSNNVCWICSNLGTLEIQLSFDLSALLKLSCQDDGIFQCHASTLSKISRRGLRCITANYDLAHHLSFLSWFHVYLVSKGVFNESLMDMLLTHNVNLGTRKSLVSWRTSCLRSFGVMFRQPRKTKSIKINNQVTMLMCFLVIDVGTWFLKHGIGS